MATKTRSSSAGDRKSRSGESSSTVFRNSKTTVRRSRTRTTTSIVTKKRKRNDRLNWNDRYSEDFKRGVIQPEIHAATGYHCCFCLKKVYTKADREVHHSAYRNFLGRVRDFERQSKGLSLFSVCKPCHDILHKKENWRYDRLGSNPVFDAGNTEDIESRLQFGYALLERLVNTGRIT